MLEMASHASFTKQKYSGGIPIWYPPIRMDLRLICMVHNSFFVKITLRNSKVVDKYFLNIYLSIYFSHRCRLGKNNFNSLHTIIMVAIPILASAILFCDFLLGLRGYLDLFS